MKKIISLFLIAIIAAFLGYFLGKFSFKYFPDNNITINKIWLIVSIVPIYFLVVGVHEAGHAIAGIYMSFDFKMYILGPFLFEKVNEKWKLKWNRNLNLAGGMVVCLPKSDENLRKRFMNYIAGGPLASFLLALFAAYAYFHISNIEKSSILIFLKYLSVIVTFLSLTIFIVTSIPMRASNFFSDGGRFLRLLKNDKTAEMEVLFLKIMAKANAGTRPKELNKIDLQKAFDLATELKDPFLVYLKSYLYQNSFDLGDFEKAEIHLNTYLEHINLIPEAFRGSAWLDASIFYSFAKGNLEKAEEFYLKFKPNSFIPKAQIYTAEALLEKLKGNEESALKFKNNAIIELPNMIDKGMIEVFKDIFESDLEKLKIKF